MHRAPATQLFVRLRPEATSLGGGLYEFVTAVDPMLRLSEVGTVAGVWGPPA
jgi:hypothetical protein